ncbi:HRDC domain protein [compost metagenome]
MSDRDKLVELRKLLAKKSGMPIYSVFDDEELERLLVKRPRSIDSLSEIKGFPKKGIRVKKYGEYIINMFIGSKTETGEVKLSTAFM